MRFLSILFLFLMASSVEAQQGLFLQPQTTPVSQAQHYNRFGQPAAVTMHRRVTITPTIVLPGLFIQAGGVTVDMEQLRNNRLQRQGRTPFMQRRFPWRYSR